MICGVEPVDHASRRFARVAYATCAWTLAYAALKLYWAAGGTALRSTLAFPIMCGGIPASSW
jgi:hypothetical protein